jgi:transglutaminase-like putative cysteine protease
MGEERDSMKFLIVPLPEEIQREECAGNYGRAKAICEQRLTLPLPRLLKERLEYECERIQRILYEYPILEEEAKRKLFDSIEGFSEDEWRSLEKRGYLDAIPVEGRMHYERRYADNLVFALPEYKKRMPEDVEKTALQTYLHARLDKLIAGDPPKTYKIIAEMKVAPDISRIHGARLRCWLPFPKVGNPVLSTRLLECSHDSYDLAPNDALQRTIYMEDQPRENLSFWVRFEYTIKEQMNRIDPEAVSPSHLNTHLGQHPPHIIFTEFLKELTGEIVGDEENPYIRAKRIYDWITLNVKYSFMHAYSLYSNLSEFAACNLRGDCGVQALLFITMCRIAGVSASWQSGWEANPFHIGSHDWAVFHVEPYGWLPADPSFGGGRKETPRYREFYFTNLDAFRMIANADFMRGFSPEKKHWRSDPTDNQSGELETEEGNVYYDAFKEERRIISFEEVKE